MKETLLTLLRDQSTPLHPFRAAADQLAQILAFESAQWLAKKECKVQTPLGTAHGHTIGEIPLLVPILRAGLVLLPAFLQVYLRAPVGLLGIRRDEATAHPKLYYQNLPSISGENPVFILEPMIATGGSAKLAIELLQKMGAKQIRIISVLGSQEGVDRLKKEHPEVILQIAQIDPKLNAERMIVPGLGDFGDRYFGTCT